MSFVTARDEEGGTNDAEEDMEPAEDCEETISTGAVEGAVSALTKVEDVVHRRLFRVCVVPVRIHVGIRRTAEQIVGLTLGGTREGTKAPR